MRILVVCTLALALAPQVTRPAPFDIVIRNGHVIDGTGSPWYAADVGIRNGRIAAIGRLANAPARQVIDARGQVVAPGFIDMLGQSELTLLVEPHVPSKIFQGITTEITGEGGSVAPLNDAIIKADKVGYAHLKITPDWRTLGQYFARVEKQGLGINMATYVGATQVRRMVLGDEDAQPTAAELERMKALVREAMAQGGRWASRPHPDTRALREDRGGAHRGSMATWLVLHHAFEAPDLSQSHLAARLDIEAPTLVRHLDKLEADGLLERRRDLRDRRAVRVQQRPTPAETPRPNCAPSPTP